jgi:catechol 2,3-dioxygenase-like lactoylglutathione lyase family enzyme
MIGRMHHVVLDCQDPTALAAFYSALLGLPVTYRDHDWVVVARDDTSSGLAFQRATDHRPPTWPDPAVPQQVHLDIMVEDPDTAGSRVLALGAERLDGEHVYADPAGHPFCLIRRPQWAPPIPPDSQPGTGIEHDHEGFSLDEGFSSNKRKILRDHGKPQPSSLITARSAERRAPSAERRAPSAERRAPSGRLGRKRGR